MYFLDREFRLWLQENVSVRGEQVFYDSLFQRVLGQKALHREHLGLAWVPVPWFRVLCIFLKEPYKMEFHQDCLGLNYASKVIGGLRTVR